MKTNKLAYATLEDLKPTFHIDDKEYYVMDNLTRPLRVGAKIRIGSRLFYVQRCDELLTQPGFGLLLIEVNHGTSSLD